MPDQPSGQERHILVVNDGKRRAIALDAAAYSLGRDPSNAISLNVETISRQHAMLVRVPVPGTKAYQYRVVDGNAQGKPSANGVFVNGQSCRTQDLKNGDIIRFGHTVEASYMTVLMEEAEFANYLESISYQSLKSDTLNAKETLVAATLSEEDLSSVPLTTLHNASSTSQRPTVAPWAETVHEQQSFAQQQPSSAQKTQSPSHPYRLWMLVIPSIVLVLGGIAAAWFWAAQSRPSSSSATSMSNGSGSNGSGSNGSGSNSSVPSASVR